MNKCEGHIMLPKAEACANLIKACYLNPTAESVSIDDALGRVAAEDVNALITLPSMKSSRMDGIAVRYADFEAGAPDTSSWKEGEEFAFCNCGIGISDKYDTTIRIEDVDFDEENRLIIHALPKEKGQWITPPGSVIKAGTQIVKKGDVLTPFLISRLATGGYASVNVIRKPVVAFVPTGNELVPAGEPVPEGMNIDSNSHMMRAKIVLWGGEPLIYPIQKDDPDQLEKTFADAIEKADIIVVNAGSSQGRHDYTIETLNKLGNILSHIIMSGPGAHTSCTVAHNGKPIVGIPGPAVGAECTVDWFVKPLIDVYFGHDPAIPKVKVIYNGEDIPYTAPSNGWFRIGRAMLHRDENGRLLLDPVEFGDNDGVNRSNAFLPVNSEGLKKGQELEVELRYPYRFV